MKFYLPGLLLMSICFGNAAHVAETTERDIFADTWVGTDALGRVVPDCEAVGPVKLGQRRVVGIFYIAWHSDLLAGMKSPYAADVSKVLAADSKARLDAKHPLWTEGSYHWGEPELGYFLSKDRFVIRKDMSMLADAGVDVLVMDVTNAVLYWDEWDVIFGEMEKMKAEGNKVPAICFWAFNGPVISVVQDLYEKIYLPGKHKDLWFYWDGKPLLLYNGTPNFDATPNAPRHKNPHYDPAAKTDKNHPHYGDREYSEEFYSDYTSDVKKFFTLRTMWWGYNNWAGKRFVGTEDNWSFGYDLGDEKVKAMKPEAMLSRHNGVKEEAAVTPAQHPSSLVGKSWSRKSGEPQLNEFDLPVATQVPWMKKTVEHPEGYGIYFQERWDEAIQADPQFLYINDWNEWTAGKYSPENGKTTPFMRRDSNYFFVDQYNAEFNRAIQPMKGGYSDNYYMQMAENIRRYKGVRPIPTLRGGHTVTIDGDFGDWVSSQPSPPAPTTTWCPPKGEGSCIDVEYRDTIGDTIHRDNAGYGGLHYRDDSGRNDIVTCKVAVDDEYVYFYAETAEPLTPHTGKNWMLLLIDADRNHDTGWQGYDFLVSQKIVDEGTTTIMRFESSSPENPWIEAAQLKYRSQGKKLELAVPRKLPGLAGDALSFDFHWCDNPTDIKDPISLCTSGDSAPNRRFNYRCVWKK